MNVVRRIQVRSDADVGTVWRTARDMQEGDGLRTMVTYVNGGTAPETDGDGYPCDVAVITGFPIWEREE